MRAGASGFCSRPPTRKNSSAPSGSSPPETRCSRSRSLNGCSNDFSTSHHQGPRPPPRLDQLTDREIEVLTLIGRGLSNAEIAEALFLSQTTIKTHLAHFFAKLALRDRVQAVVLAYEAGLVRPGTTK